MNVQLVVFLLLGVFAVGIISENCKVAGTCTLEACANNGTVECENSLCTCVNHNMGCSGQDHGCDKHRPCHEHGHGHHSSWHCLDGECRCI